MKNIKLIYFDAVGIPHETMVARLKSICSSLYIISDGLIVAEYEGSSKELYNSIMPEDNKNHVLICDIDIANGTYWGFMGKDLWQWLEKSRKED